MRAMRIDDIGGARVLRIFSLDGKRVPSGTMLDQATLARMPAANRNSLIEGGYLHVWPKLAAVPIAGKAERLVVSRGFGKFDVIEGRILNESPLTKEDAEKLAATAEERKH